MIAKAITGQISLRTSRYGKQDVRSVHHTPRHAEQTATRTTARLRTSLMRTTLRTCTKDTWPTGLPQSHPVKLEHQWLYREMMEIQQSMTKITRANVFSRIFRKHAHAELIKTCQRALHYALCQFLVTVRPSVISASRFLCPAYIAGI